MHSVCVCVMQDQWLEQVSRYQQELSLLQAQAEEHQWQVQAEASRAQAAFAEAELLKDMVEKVSVNSYA